METMIHSRLFLKINGIPFCNRYSWEKDLSVWLTILFDSIMFVINLAKNTSCEYYCLRLLILIATIYFLLIRGFNKVSLIGS